MSLTGDGHALYLKGSPADPSYTATYPVANLSAMTVTVGVHGDLTAACASGGAAVACKSLPFFADVGAKETKVYDAYGHAILAAPMAGGFDAGGLPTLLDAGATGGLGGVGIDAGNCAPSVTASLSGCTFSVGSVTCDCSDASCAASAIEGCLSSLGVPNGGGAGGGVFEDGGFGGLLPDDGGLSAIGAFGDAGSSSAACSSGAISAAEVKFCSDVDAWLTAHGVSATLDCATLGTLTFPSTLPPAPTTGFTCDQVTHDAFVTVRATLGTCDPLDYLGWDSSAQLQLFEDGVCTVW